MNLSVVFLSSILGFGVGGPVSKLMFLNQNASFESPIDMYDFNVFYDLATLYGDKNQDGVLSQEEYLNFSDKGYKELIPNGFDRARNQEGEPLVDTSYSFLGILPVSNRQVYTYVYTKDQISSTYTKDGYFNYSAKGWEYGLSYFNNPELSEDGKYINTIPKTSTMKFINEYSLGSDGYFSKFVIEDNQIIQQSEEAKTAEGYYSMRIKPERLIVSFDNQIKLDKRIENYELCFDSNYWNDENRMKNTLFSEKTIKIEDAAIDGFLCANDSENNGSGWNFLLGSINGNQEQQVNSAYEFYYYFFNIEDFEPDSILSITYSYVPITWKHTYYNKQATNAFAWTLANQVMDSSKKGITAYTREQARRITNEMSSSPYYIKNQGKNNEEKFYLGYSETKHSRVTRTVNYDDEFVVDVNVPGVWNFVKHKRSVNIKSIINMKNVDSEVGEKKTLVGTKEEYDLNSQLRSFLKGETSDTVDALYEDVDHNRYNWAFLIHENDWIRTAQYEKIDEYPVGLTLLWAFLTAGIYSYTDNTSQIVSTCHEPDSVLVTYMKVAKDDKFYNLNVISNPLSVRKNYIVGYAAPGLLDIIVKAMTSFFKNYGWIFWIIFIISILLILGILGLIFKPVKVVLKHIGKGILYTGELIINTAYIISIWWWLAIIKKARKEQLPPTWLFKK